MIAQKASVLRALGSRYASTVKLLGAVGLGASMGRNTADEKDPDLEGTAMTNLEDEMTLKRSISRGLQIAQSRSYLCKL